jgi:energy-coupling factor transporter ATP-binding protein EcfA2
MDNFIVIDNLKLNSGYHISDLTITLSQSVALIGRAGSGKTEFCLKILDSNFLENISPENIYKEIGYVPSDPSLLFSGMKSTLKGELELSLQFIGKNINFIDEIAELYDVTDLLKRNVFTLSGGEAIRAAVAVVGAKKPKVWILDQIFDWLHPDKRSKIRELIKQNSAKDVITIETHCCTPEWIEDFDLCLFLDSKKNVRKGKFKELFFSISDQFLLGGNYEINELYDKKLGNRNFILPKTNNSIFLTANRKTSNNIKVKDLNYSYPNNNFSLNKIDLTAKSGDVVSLVGSNGAGKTTLLKCFALLIKPDSGLVMINDVIATIKTHLRAKQFLYCFQNPDDQLFLSTVKEELLTTLKYLRNDKKIIDEDLLNRFDLLSVKDLDPFSLNRSCKKMVNLAGCFMVNPPVLLLDEPTAGLDGYQKSQLFEEIKNYTNNGGICIMISHDNNFMAKITTTTIVMEAGSIVQCEQNVSA